MKSPVRPTVLSSNLNLSFIQDLQSFFKIEKYKQWYHDTSLFQKRLDTCMSNHLKGSQWIEIRKTVTLRI